EPHGAGASPLVGVERKRDDEDPVRTDGSRPRELDPTESGVGEHRSEGAARLGQLPFQRGPHGGPIVGRFAFWDARGKISVVCSVKMSGSRRIRRRKEALWKSKI